MAIVTAKVISWFIEQHFRRWDLIIHWFSFWHIHALLWGEFSTRGKSKWVAKQGITYNSVPTQWHCPQSPFENSICFARPWTESFQFEPWHRNINHICQYVEYSKYWILLEWAMVTFPTIFLGNLYSLLLKIIGRRGGGREEEDRKRRRKRRRRKRGIHR